MDIAESKKQHLWRKVIWHTNPDDHPLGPRHSVEVYCCEEANGYTVWYVRRLGKDDTRGIAGTETGDYLIDFFGKTRRDDAIERAVLLANSDADISKIIETLDRIARDSKRVA